MGKKRPGESKTSKRNIEAVYRQEKALELRKLGYDFRSIARELNYSSVAGAYKAVMSALDRVLQEPAEEVRQMELERVDLLWHKLMQRLSMPGAIKLGELQSAIFTALKIMERRARYLGLDMPTKIAPTDPTGAYEYAQLSDPEIVAEFLTIINAARPSKDPRDGDGPAASLAT